jgi:GTP-binding protein
MDTQLLGYELLGPEIRSTRMGSLIAAEPGVAVTYGLNNAQQRGETFIEPGTEVYEGMVVGINARDTDLVVNVCKQKKLTNMRAAAADIAIKLSPPVRFTLEEFLDFIADDELLEVTPKSLRLRKRVLSLAHRHKLERSQAKV